jgi:hypothetical protein
MTTAARDRAPLGWLLAYSGTARLRVRQPACLKCNTLPEHTR